MLDACRALIDRGADPDATDAYQRSPYQVAHDAGNAECAEVWSQASATKAVGGGSGGGASVGAADGGGGGGGGGGVQGRVASSESGTSLAAAQFNELTANMLQRTQDDLAKVTHTCTSTTNTIP